MPPTDPFAGFSVRKQAGPNTCVAACAISVLSHLGGPSVDEAVLFAEISDPEGGSQFQQLARHLPSLAPGWSVRFDAFRERDQFDKRLRDLHQAHGAVLVARNVEQSGRLHCFVVTEVEDEHTMVHDPADGSRQRMLVSTLQADSTKELAALVPPKDFRELATPETQPELLRAGLTISDAESAVRMIDDLLPAGWLLKQTSHPFRSWLHRNVALSGVFGLEIGRDIAVLERANVVNLHEVAAQLLVEGNNQPTGKRTYEGFFHARAVLAAAARLASAGLVVELEPPPKDPSTPRRADIRVKGPRGAARLEVKAQESSLTSDRLVEAETKFNMYFRPPAGSYEVALDPEIARRWAGLEDDGVREQAVRLVAEVATEVATVAERHRDGQWHGGRYGVAVRWVSDREGVQSMIDYSGHGVGWTPDDSVFIKRLLTKRVEEQLASDVPGFVLAEFVGLRCNIQHLDLLLEATTRANPTAWRHVPGIVWCRGLFGGPRQYGLIANPTAAVDAPWWLLPALNRSPSG